MKNRLSSLVIVVGIGAAMASGTAGAVSLFRDEFDGAQLGASWQIVRKDPSHWSLTSNPGSLQITTQMGEFFLVPKPANLFLVDPQADYDQIETHLTFDPSQDFQQAGLLIYVDDSNYMKFDRIWASNLPGNDVVEFYDRVTDTRRTAVVSADTLHMRISKSGDDFTASYSTDGANFIDVGTLTTSALIAPRLGLFAMNGNRFSPDVPAAFDFFAIRLKCDEACLFYEIGFGENGVGSDFLNWLDTGPGNSLVFEDNFDSIDLGPKGHVFGTTSTAVNIHSHHDTDGGTTGIEDGWNDYLFTGQFKIDNSSGGVGVTFYSEYPVADHYYRLRRYAGFRELHLSQHGSSNLTSCDAPTTAVDPAANVWYSFRIEAMNDADHTRLRAKVWSPDVEDEPEEWQQTCLDENPLEGLSHAQFTRRSSGTVGLWSMGPGGKYWRDFRVVCKAGDGCDDGDPCNGREECDWDVGECASGQLPCRDGVPCTEDLCIAVDDTVDCSFPPRDCDDFVDCTLDSCDPQSGACIHETDDGFCEDGNECTVNECTVDGCVSEALTGTVCEVCTTDVCLNGECLAGLPSAVPQTGQTTCWDASGSPIECSDTGQDGELQKGVSTSPRFTDNGDGTVTDNLTGLIWLKNANCFGYRNWSNALSDANALASASDACTPDLTDGSLAGEWRLPNHKELQSLLDYGQFLPALPAGHPFSDVQWTYWSSTTRADSPGDAWFAGLGNGAVSTFSKTSGAYVWPVQGGP